MINPMPCDRHDQYNCELCAVIDARDKALAEVERLRKTLKLIAGRELYAPGRYTQDTDISNWAITKCRKALAGGEP